MVNEEAEGASMPGEMKADTGVLSLTEHQRFDSAAEEALLARCRRQDLEAFSRIVDAYQSRIFGFVRRMVRSEEEAQDIAQEVFIKAFQAMGRFDGRSSLRTWLFRIAHNLCIDRSRKLERNPAPSSLTFSDDTDDVIEVSDRRWSPEDIILNDELAEVVETALGGMSEKLKTVLLLHDREEMAYEEIAAAVNVPVGTVKSRLFLARAHLQKAVSGYMNQKEVDA
jgi:RNA polymerase sigma-70 factor, ECF subfamily